MRIVCLPLIIVGFVSVAALKPVHGSSVEHVQDTIERWIDTQRIVEETRKEWSEQKQLLEREAVLLELEFAELEERQAKLNSINSKSGEDRVAAESSKKRYTGLLELLEARSLALESRLMGLYPAFPEPLKERLISAIPSEGAAPSLNVSARLRYLISILTEADKFNRELTFVNETRTLDGKERQMKVLYWGLAAAYAIDWEGATAQVGRPSATGWVWTDRSEYSEQIAQLISVHQVKEDPAFVGVPVVVTEVKSDD